MAQVSRAVLLSIAVGIGLGLAVGFVWPWTHETPRAPRSGPATASAPSPPSGAADPEDWRNRFEALEEILTAEIEARRGFEAELADLREQLSHPPWSELTASEEPADSDRGTGPDESQPRFDEAVLIEAGMNPQQAAELHERFDEFELDRLYMQDRAMRGGYWFKPRHRSELVALQEDLREGLGDELYDFALFASGQNNRVIVRDVLDRSPAHEAGILPGDIFVSYGNDRIFTVQELRVATAEGEAGKLVPLEVLRGERQVRVHVPRGPLGTGLRTERRRPSNIR